MGKASMGSKSNNGGSSKGKSLSSVETAYKTRSLLTKGEKLIIIRNALFDDDEGGFGAERDVTRWLAPAFRSFEKNGVNATIEFAHGESLVGNDLADLVDLAAVFSEEVEEDAGREYYAEDKEEHLTEDAARYLIVRDEHGKIVGFAHFRFTLHGELADQMEGEPCLFIYDLHIEESLQRKGLGRHLLIMLELIARKGNCSEMVMPIPETPLADNARLFMLDGLKGWKVDNLMEIAPKTSKALKEDGSLCVFVKVIKSRQVEEPVEEVTAQLKSLETTISSPTSSQDESSESAAEEKTNQIEATEEDDWGVEVTNTPSPASNKKKGGKNGKKKKGGKKQTPSTNPTGATIQSPIELLD